METPIFPCHVFESEFINVYEPSEDTFLLIDALEKDLNMIKMKNPLICVEIGCGSGAVITALAMALGPSAAAYFATDINPFATQTAQKCSDVNQVSERIEFITTDLASSIDDRLKGCVDLLIFNPPYVPTPAEEISLNSLSSSWSGGVNGRHVIDRFLMNTVPSLLSPNGLLYLIIIRENNVNDICETMKLMGFHTNVVIQRKCGREYLMALRFNRT